MPSDCAGVEQVAVQGHAAADRGAGAVCGADAGQGRLADHAERTHRRRLAVDLKRICNRAVARWQSGRADRQAAAHRRADERAALTRRARNGITRRIGDGHVDRIGSVGQGGRREAAQVHADEGGLHVERQRYRRGGEDHGSVRVGHGVGGELLAAVD